MKALHVLAPVAGKLLLRSRNALALSCGMSALLSLARHAQGASTQHVRQTEGEEKRAEAFTLSRLRFNERRKAVVAD